MKTAQRTQKHESFIGIMSDSHDKQPAIKKATDYFTEKQVDLVLHAGDVVSAFTADIFRNLTCNLKLVYGNNDGDKLFLRERFAGIGTFYGDPYFMELHGLRIVLTHHPELVDSLAKTCDIVVYGHTHEPDIRRYGKALIINPGECCGYLTGVETVALFSPKTMETEIVEL